MYEEEIKVEATSAAHRAGFTYSHASYGMIHVSRQTIGGDGRELFGSGVKSNTQMSIMIEEAQVTQDLGRNWYFGNKRVTEVLMSPVQYAEMISNPNTQGVPCTLKFTQDKGNIEYRGIDTQTQYIESAMEEDVTSLKKRASTINKEVHDILSKKGTMKKDDKETIKDLVNRLSMDLVSNLPFYEECLKKSINRTKMEAKTEVESYLQNAISRTGLEALKSPEVLQLVFKED